MPTPADLFLSPDLTEAQARAYLESLGFRDPVAADTHLQRMADDLVVRETLGRVASDLFASLLESPDPDAALEGLSHYVAARTGRSMFLDYLREDPRALHVLTYVMGTSPMLSEILIRTPEYFHWLVAQVDRSAPDRQDHEEELVSVFANIGDAEEALNILRRWKLRETLRVGTRELLRRETVQTVLAQLSDLACVAVDFALAIIMRQVLDASGLDAPPGTFAIIATGQLGAGELDYGRDVDLLYVYEARPESDKAAQDFFVKAGRDLTAALEAETREGALYKVRTPSGTQTGGRPEATALADFRRRYDASRDHLERRALARARPVAGDGDLGRRFIETIDPFVYGRLADNAAVDAQSASVEDRGSAEIERFTEHHQLRHGVYHPELRRAGTLAVLEVMARAGLIEETVRRELDHAYIFLRSAEHRRQLGLKENVENHVAASRERVRQIVRGR